MFTIQESSNNSSIYSAELAKHIIEAIEKGTDGLIDKLANRKIFPEELGKFLGLLFGLFGGKYKNVDLNSKNTIDVIVFLAKKVSVFSLTETNEYKNMLCLASKCGYVDLTIQLIDFLMENEPEKTPYHIALNVLCNLMQLMETSDDVAKKLEPQFRALYSLVKKSNIKNYFTHQPNSNEDCLYAYNSVFAYAKYHGCSKAFAVLCEDETIKKINEMDLAVYKPNDEAIRTSRSDGNQHFFTYGDKKRQCFYAMIDPKNRASSFHNIFNRVMTSSKNDPGCFLRKYFNNVYGKSTPSSEIEDISSKNSARDDIISNAIAFFQNGKLNIETANKHITSIVNYKNYHRHPLYKTFLSKLKKTLAFLLNDKDSNIENINQLYNPIMDLNSIRPSDSIKMGFKLIKALLASIEKEKNIEMQMQGYEYALRAMNGMLEKIAMLDPNDENMILGLREKIIEKINAILTMVENDDNLTFTSQHYIELISSYKKTKEVKHLNIDELTKIVNTGEEYIDKIRKASNEISKNIAEIFNCDNLSITEEDTKDNIQDIFFAIVKERLSNVISLLKDKASPLETSQRIVIFNVIKSELKHFLVSLKSSLFSEKDFAHLSTHLLRDKILQLNTIKTILDIEHIEDNFIDKLASYVQKETDDSESTLLNYAFITAMIELTNKYTEDYLASENKHKLESVSDIGSTNDGSISTRIERLKFHINKVTGFEQFKDHPNYALFIEKLNDATLSLNNVLSSNNRLYSKLSDENYQTLFSLFEETSKLYSSENSESIVKLQLTLMDIIKGYINTLSDNAQPKAKLDASIKLLDVSEVILYKAPDAQKKAYKEKIADVLIEIQSSRLSKNCTSSDQLAVLISAIEIASDNNLANLYSDCKKEQAKAQLLIAIDANKYNNKAYIRDFYSVYKKMLSSVMKDELVNTDENFLLLVYKKIIDITVTIINSNEKEMQIPELSKEHIDIFKKNLSEIADLLKIVGTEKNQAIKQVETIINEKLSKSSNSFFSSLFAKKPTEYIPKKKEGSANFKNIEESRAEDIYTL